jgi:hypothetical protein
MMTGDRLLKLCFLIFVIISLLVFIDVIPVDEDAQRTAEMHESMSRTCAKPEGILMGLKSLFFCDTGAREEN